MSQLVHPLNLWPESWDKNNPIKIKSNVKDPWPKSCDRDNLLERKLKKLLDLTGVKIPKPAALIMRSRYPYRKQIKTDYETQFPTDPMLND